MIEVTGGDVNGTLINAVSRLLTLTLEVGRSIGSAIYRYLYGRKC